MSGPSISGKGAAPGRIAALAAVLAVLLALTGCGYLMSYVDMVREKGVSPEYRSVLDAWTRTKVLHSQFETRAGLFATFKSPEFRAAYARDYARLYGLTEEQAKARQEVIEETASDFDEFFFYAAMPDRDANDFDKSGSIWRIYLIDDGGKRFQPAEIRKLGRMTPLVTSFYPYVNPYHGNGYVLRFPPGSAKPGKPFRLLVTGVLGGVELSWP